jgi:[ribosomal protein S18]-alanine N-acetyltransferase
MSSPSGCVLRVCEPKDLDQVGQVEKASFPDRPYTKLDFVYCMSIAGEGFIVACENGSVVGYVIAAGRGEEGSIMSIAVSPRFRERGVGERLMRSAIDYLARRFERVFLLVDVKNERAIRLYRRFSFSETGNVVEGYYQNGDDAIELTRRLRVTANRGARAPRPTP